MRLHVVFNEQGTIVAAHTLAPETAGVAMRYGVTLEKGQKEATVDVPENYAKQSLAKIAEDLRVSAGTGIHTLVAKNG